MMNKRLLILLSLILVLAMLCACGTEVADTNSEELAEESVESVETEVLDSIGEPDNSKTEVVLEVVNGTDVEIKEWKMRMNDEEEFSENMLDETDTFLPEETSILYFDPKTDDQARLAEVEVVTAKGTYTIGAFPLDDADTVTVCMKDDVMYLKYHSDTADKDMDTYEDELTRIANEKAAEEAAAAAAASSQSAPSGSASSGASYSGGSSSSSGGSSSGGSSGSGSSSSSGGDSGSSGGDTGSSGGSDDGCIGDDGLMY